jgi:cardiolipin synthase
MSVNACRSCAAAGVRVLLRHLSAPALAALLLPGCAGNAPVEPDVDTHVHHEPVLEAIRDVPRVDRALLDGKHLRLSFTAGGRQIHASVTLEPLGDRLLATLGKDLPVRVLVPAVPGGGGATQPESAPVEVRGPSAWQVLLDGSLQSLTPPGAGNGTVVDILYEDELFLYRLEGGALVAVPVIYKPPDIQVQHTYTFVDLLEVMRGQLAGNYPAGSRLLFETGDESKYGYPFVYADVSSGQILFLRYMPDPGYADSLALGTTLELFVQTLVDHVRAFFNQPVSSFSRLFTMVASTTADLAHPTPLALLEHDPVPPLRPGEAMDPVAWQAELDAVTGTTASAGRLTYRVDGAEFFPRFIDLVGSAEASVLLRVYIFDNDDYAVSIADLLRRRSADVTIRVLVDGFGTRGAKIGISASLPPGHEPEFSMIRYLEQDSAVQVRSVPNVWFTGDHTKTIVIDDEVAFLGGMNIGREYRYDWHDMMVEVEGPVVGEIVTDFHRAWISAGLLGDLRQVFYREAPDSLSASEADYPLRLLYTRPGDSQILRAQIAATRRAQRRIILENPYITSDAMLYELVKARRRGVDVRVIMPYRSDSGVISRSNVLAANAMLRNGIRVYIYPGMSHLKAAIYDGWACLGSANMDNLSLRTNREMNLATSHPPAVEELFERVFVPDMGRSVELTGPLPSNWSDYLAELLADYL